MLNLPQARHNRPLRGAQALLVLLAVFSALSWAEDSPRLVTTGSEQLHLSFEAPVVRDHGPWRQGQILTQSDPGIPHDIAPIAEVTARYESTGIEVREVRWAANLRISEAGDTGPWWSVERPLDMSLDGSRAMFEINVTAIVAEARELEAEAQVPGRLGIRVDIVHMAQITVHGVQTTAVRMATVTLTPTEAATLVALQPDEGIYRTSVAAGIPWLPIAAGLLVVAIEGLLLAGRRNWKPWERVPALRPVMVQHLEVPRTARHTDADSLFRVARRTHGTVLVDPESGVVLLAGSVELWAQTAGVAKPSVETETAERPESAEAAETVGTAASAESVDPAEKPDSLPSDADAVTEPDGAMPTPPVVPEAGPEVGPEDEPAPQSQTDARSQDNPIQKDSSY